MATEYKSAGTSFSPEESAGGPGVKPPLALREPIEHVIHGDRRVDHYAWLRKKDDPRVIAYLQDENRYTDARMAGTEGLQESLYQEMLGRIQQTDLSVPYSLRGYSYYTRTEEGKQYAIYCRKKEAAEPSPEPSPEEVLVDLNILAEGHAFLGLGVFEVSDDNSLLAYATDITGYRQYTLHVKNLSTGALLPFRAERVTSAAWASDNRTLFYAVEDEVTKRSHRLYRHVFVEADLQPAVASAQHASPPLERNDPQPAQKNDQLTKNKKPSKGGWLVPLDDSASKPADTAAKAPGTAARVIGKFGAFANMLRGTAAPVREEPEPEVIKPQEVQLPSVKPAERPEDPLLYEEKDERFRIDVERSRSGAYLFLVTNSHTTSEVRYLRADQPLATFQVIERREENHEYYVDHHPGSSADPVGGVFFIRTNSGGRTYRLMTAPATNPVREHWHEVIPNRPGVMLAACEVFRTHIVLFEREDGLPYLRIIDLTTQAPSALEASRRIEFAEPAYNAAFGANPEFDTGHVRYHYESFVTPRSVFDYDFSTGERILRKQQPVLGGYEPTRYKSERLHAVATDGTPIPISLVYRRDIPLDGTAPLLLYAYGSYGLSMPVAFSSNRLSLLERGMIYAIAHIRGGGELGKPWHDAGRMHHKMNTFTDFISSVEYLIEKQYTSPDQLVIEGGSAGGLLMGAVTNLRPDLFRVVLSHVPFVDVLNTMLDASLPLTVGEYEEWGNPELAPDYFYMREYCPYTNLERKNYPTMLVKTGLNDSQVMYWEPAKYVAKLRTLKTDANALLLKTNMGAGHGGASGRYDYLREIAFDYAFLIRELDLQSEGKGARN
jgi:protease II